MMPAVLAVAGCGADGRGDRDPPSAAPLPSFKRLRPLPRLDVAHYRVPRLLDRHDVYAADRPGRLIPRMRSIRPRVYVPNTVSDRVDVIDPRTYRIVRRFSVGREPQHVVPSYDMRTLWVNNDLGNSLTAINPRTGRRGRTVSVTDP